MKVRTFLAKVAAERERLEQVTHEGDPFDLKTSLRLDLLVLLEELLLASIGDVRSFYGLQPSPGEPQQDQAGGAGPSTGGEK